MNRNLTNQTYYQKTKLIRQEKYQLKKQQKQEWEHHQTSKYSQVENYQVLITFKEYTLLNKDKQQKWFVFSRTLKDLAANGVHNTSEIMRLGELGEILIKDYRATAKKKLATGKYWPSLTPEQQEKLIRYWSYEKARIKNHLLTAAEQLERQSQKCQREIELAKFHEERGKIKCDCYSCSESRRLGSEIKEQLFKDDQQEKSLMVEGECANCGEYKKVEAETGLCKKCGKES